MPHEYRRSRRQAPAGGGGRTHDPLHPRDLAENWEFKILRSNTGAFKDPAVMQRYLEEEARAGWTLVEKFDNSRIRLKRPAAARQQGAQCTFDPYRTRVGISEVELGMLIAGSIVGGLAVLFTAIIVIIHLVKG